MRTSPHSSTAQAIVAVLLLAPVVAAGAAFGQSGDSDSGGTAPSPGVLPAAVPSPSPVLPSNADVLPTPSVGNAVPTSPSNPAPPASPRSASPYYPTNAPRMPLVDPFASGNDRASRKGSSQARPDPDFLDLNPARSKPVETRTISEEPERIRRGSASPKSMEDCMRNWDAKTHMSKALWRTTCERLLR